MGVLQEKAKNTRSALESFGAGDGHIPNHERKETFQ